VLTLFTTPVIYLAAFDRLGQRWAQNGWMLLLPDFYTFMVLAFVPSCLGSYLIDSSFRSLRGPTGRGGVATHFLWRARKWLYEQPTSKRQPDTEKKTNGARP
jgi:hypothetical protein